MVENFQKPSTPADGASLRWRRLGQAAIKTAVVAVVGLCAWGAATAIPLFRWNSAIEAACKLSYDGDTAGAEQAFASTFALAGTDPLDPRVLITLRKLEFVYETNRKFENCEKVLLHCLEIDQRTGDPESKAADSLALGKVYRKMQRFSQAEPYLRQAMAFYSSAPQVQKNAHPLLQSQDMLAWCLAGQSRYPEAIEQCAKELAASRQYAPNQKALIAWPSATMAWIYKQQGRVADEKKTVQQAFDAARQSDPQTDYYFVIPYNLLGNLARELSMFTEAELFFDLAEKYCDRFIAKNNLFYADLWESKAKLMADWDKAAEASILVKKAEKLRKAPRPFATTMPIPQFVLALSKQ